MPTNIITNPADDNEHPQPLPNDLFSSLENLRIDPRMADGPTVTRALVTVPVRKPSREWFVRCHPNATYSLDTLVLELREDSEIYLVHPTMREALANESTVHAKRLRLTVNRQGDPFLWPARLPGADGRLDAWNEVALQAMSMAETRWLRLSANRRIGTYDVMEASIAHEPVFPAMPMTEIARVAFRDRVIDSPNHPVLRRLRGEE